MTQTHTIVGRGNRDGATLFQKWFSELNHTAETGGQAAYVFVMGSLLNHFVDSHPPPYDGGNMALLFLPLVFLLLAFTYGIVHIP